MGLIELVVTLAVVGFVLYLIITYIPMAPPIKNIIVIVVVIFVIVWLLQQFGVIGSVGGADKIRIN